MSTVTPNFNWPVPQSSDLVKNGATAMASLGDAIDASFVDLKGGTTGQVLAKATNSDLDYVWTDANPGDITGVTAGTGITGGGTSGTVTVSFDQANFGGGQYAAGKNKIINGDFGVWQRGTTFTSPASTAYTADRFDVVQNGTGTSTISQQAFTLGTAPVSGYESTYFLRHLVTAVGTSTVNGIEQRIENVRTFAGQTMTVSFWAKADTARTITMRVDQFFGSGGSPSATITGTAYTFSATTAWTRFSQTITMPSIAGKTLGTNLNDAVYVKIYNANTLNSQMDIWGIQAEAGTTATPFQTASGSIQGELALCQRYYYKTFAQGTAPAQNAGAVGAVQVPQVVAGAVNQTVTNVRFPVTMRATPTITIFNTQAANAQIRNPNAGADWTSSVVEATGDSGVSFQGTPPASSGAGSRAVFHFTAEIEL